jgi:hypothetical protein
MPKRVSSPSLRWPGEVVFFDPLSLPQALAWEHAIRDSQNLDRDNITITDINYALLPGICACVEKWELDRLGDPPDPFPASPRKESIELMDWLIGEITAIYSGEEEKADPNE